MRIGLLVAPLLLGLAPLVSPGAVGPTAHTVQRTVYLMGTHATFVVHATDRGVGLRQLDQMVRSVERTEAELSTWQSESVLSTLNRQPIGEPFTLSSPVCGLWGELTARHRDTDGAFDPAIGSLIEAWGLRAGGRHPSTADLAAARRLSGMAHLRFDAVGCQLTRAAAVTVDAGAFGKGEALRRLVRMQDALPARWMVDLGGQLAVSGAPVGGWEVAIAHPTRRAEAAVALSLDSGSLATSGASERSYAIEGGMVTHILDPRTGRPLYRPGSVTLWHEDALTADILSTALYVLGPEAGLRYADEHRLAALFLAPAGEAADAAVTPRASRAFRQRFQGVSSGRTHPGS